MNALDVCAQLSTYEPGDDPNGGLYPYANHVAKMFVEMHERLARQSDRIATLEAKQVTVRNDVSVPASAGMSVDELAKLAKAAASAGSR